MSTQSNDQARSTRIAIVSSLWHNEIVDEGVRAFRESIGQLRGCTVEEFAVPGAFEIPLHALRLAQTGRYAAVATCGLIVDGGIYRHEFVSAAVIDGLMRVQLDTGIPVFSAVLTPHHFHEHADHAQFFKAHFQTKGAELARACHTTLLSLDTVR